MQWAGQTHVVVLAASHRLMMEHNNCSHSSRG